MPSEARWYEEPRVAFIEVTGQLTLEDLRASSAQLEDMIRTGEAPVHSIIDITKMEKIQVRNLLQFRNAIIDPNTPGVGWTVIAGTDRLVHFFGNVAAQLARVDFKVVSI